MSMTFSDDQRQISAPGTKHTAHLYSSISWRVTWLRQDHGLTRNQAITAMTLAELIESHAIMRLRISGMTDSLGVTGSPGPPLQSDREAAEILGREAWMLVKAWASELGLSGLAAINMITRDRRWEPGT